MGLILIGPGQMMALRGRLALRQPLQTTAPTTPPPASPSTAPDMIAGLVGWWDASTLMHLLGPGDLPLSAWRTPCAAVADRSSAGNQLVSYRFLSDGRVAAPYPHLSGNLGGVGQTHAAPGLLTPALD